MFSPRQVLWSLLAVGLLSLLVSSRTARATALTVPDEVPTIQAAIDRGVDTVLVRPGVYAETPVVSLPVRIAATTAAATERPTLQGLAIRPWRGLASDVFEFRHLRFEGPVLVVNDDELSDIRFDHCDLAAGADDSSRYLSTRSISLSKCFVAGTARLFVAESCQIDSCQVSGQVWVGDGTDLRVKGCVFEGSGNGFAIASSIIHSCFVEGNTIRNYAGGVGAEADYGSIANNLIEDCSDAGVRASGEITVANNMIRRCQVVGVDQRSSYHGIVSGNTIEHCGWRGVWITSADIEVVGNVIHHCGGDGLEVRTDYSNHVRIAQNTSCFNGGSGFASRYPNIWTGTPVITITHNIGFANGEYGLTWPVEDVATVGCNDWFANAVGAVGGRALSGDDFSVDPRFCNLDSADFRLQADSPLLDRTGCGGVGALGMGCGVTATLVQRFAAARVSEGIQIIWQVSEGATAADIWLERAEGRQAGDWVRPLTERSMDGRGVVELDRAVSADRSYWYRLVSREHDQVETLAPPILVESEEQQGFGLSRVVPNPGAGRVRIEFSLERTAEIDLGVFDVQGRGIAVLARGVWPAGKHVVEWSGLRQDGGAAPPGWYVVRYRYPGGRDSRRLIRFF